jgi:hypothetical protein
MRTNIAQEIAIREAVDNAIQEAALISKIVYPLPSTIVYILSTQGYDVSKPTVISRYKEKGIVCENGLWVKAVECFISLSVSGSS